ncbi:RcgA family putative transporter [uncultured Ruegeria sp.]|uniref:RcgA family putative transporter n=1 Tax=uncultured Ruegeria sp. TaxID=259304 RepID=UPI00262A5E03|nr:hypothetical protein [uncultured Ruegeria sp.]
MITNKRNISLPPKNGSDFKELFKYATDIGVGLPIGGDGLPIGTWTPQTLAAALSEIETNRAGVDLRAVQHWFEDNDKGISAPSINLLARVFGGDNTEATTAWRSELTAGQRRLMAKRKASKNKSKRQPMEAAVEDLTPAKLWPDVAIPVEEFNEPSSVQTDSSGISGVPHHPKTFAERCEQILSGSESMNLLITYWLVFCGLGLMNFVFNTLSVTYSPFEGLDKQVGFIWAPTLTVLPLVALPLFIYYVSELTTYWKRVGRPNCISQVVSTIDSKSNAAWYAKVNNFSFSFWAIALFCFFFVFGFQWSGIYLPAYLSGDANGVQIDRYLVALVRPEAISIEEAMVLSFVGYMYTASYIAVFMFGLLFFVIVVLDFHDISTTLDVEGNKIESDQIRREGQKVVWGGFRVVVFALWLATLVKLQITYLSSDSSNFLSWLSTDMAGALDATALRNGWLENSSISHFTTFMMMAVTVSVFIFGVLRIRRSFERLSVYGRDQHSTRDYLALFEMLGVIALLSTSLVLVGRFTGFSIIVGISAIASLHVLSGPKLRTF